MKLILTIFCFYLTALAHAVVDRNVDGMGDVWQLKYPGLAIAATTDTDGDGQSNAAESAAGTNPYEANDIIRVSSIVRNGNDVTLQWPSILGKRYQVECNADLASNNWQDIGSIYAGSDNALTAMLTITNHHQFFRVRVFDIDTDNDGVTDWEEMQLGYDPNHNGPGSCNCGPNCTCYPECHCADTDLQRLTYALQAPSYVSIIANDADASEPNGTSPADPGTFTITRSGGLANLTILLSKSGATNANDHNTIATSVTLAMGVNSTTITVTPLADLFTESDEAVILTISPHSSYVVAPSPSAALLVHDNIVANGTGLFAEFFNEATNIGTTNPPLFTNRILTRTDPVINYTWPSGTTQGVNSPAVGVNVDYFSSRWSGEILPEFSQTYTFELICNLGARLWVNGQLLVNNWPGNGSTVTATTYTGLIDLDGGKRVPIVLEQYDNTSDAKCILSWQAASLTKELVPMVRMFPQTPPQLIGSASKILLQNSGTQTWQLSASGNTTAFTARGLPSGWSINASNGLLSGPTTQAGTWLIPVIASNAYGMGSAILQLDIIATGGTITHETWNNISPTATVANFNWSSNVSSSSTLPTAEIPLSQLANSAQRLRGYMTAPETGMYRFWITGDDSAELLISNDNETINLFSRATLTTSTTVKSWTNGAQSQILWLEAGHRYYWEARTINQSDDAHLAIGWLLPSQGNNDPMAVTSPSAVIPSYALSPWINIINTETTGTLYTAQISAQGANLTGGYGNATLQVNEAETAATLRFVYANLTAPKTGAHIHSSAHGGAIIYDIDTSTPQADGSYLWTFVAAGAITIDDIKNVIKNGQAYINIHSANYPGGEISGTMRPQVGSKVFTIPANPPAWSDDHTDRNAAARFLTQATYGTTDAEILSVQSLGYSGWIDQQFTTPKSSLYNEVFATRNVSNPNNNTYTGNQAFNAWWKQSVTGPDQLRQRIAFALSQIFVASEAGVLDEKGDALSDYYDMLLDQSFGNVRDLIENVSLHPTMGRYLDMLKNERPDKASGRIPNENYAREILQLFSIGLYRMHPDGSLMLNSQDQPIPTYDQEEIIGFAHAFTGWNYNQADVGGYKPVNWSPSGDWLNPMREVPDRHDIGTKRLLNNVVLPGLPKITTSANVVINLNPNTNYSSNSTSNTIVRTDDEFQNLAAQEMDATHDSIFLHPNIGPFLCRQLIQRLVTSTPSNAYVYRVVKAFENNGSGVRGDLKAVIKAILLDYEARSANVINQQRYGKQKEPLLRITAIARAFLPTAPLSATYQQTDGFITFTTATPHRLVSGNPININVTSGSPSPATGGTYAVTTPVNTNDFTVRVKEVLPFSYAQSGTTVTATMTTGTHGLITGHQVFVKFLSGGIPNGLYPINYISTTQFSFNVANSATLTGTAIGVKHSGGYAMAANNASVAITCATNHHLNSGNMVYLTFTPVSGQTTSPTNGLYPVTVVDDTKITITNSAGPLTAARSGIIVMSPENPILSFTGNASTAYSTFAVNESDTDLAQTPMRSPTVFNFYMPDYQFPGTLATNKMVTPEFQLSSDTNVIRQSNFIYEGIFKPTGNSSVSSFRSGSGALALDFTQWLGNRPSTTVPWTDNTNISALIDEFSTLLTSGQLSSEAKTIITNYVTNTANIGYTTGAATEIQRRDRIRAIIHLITTSPDFSIQK